VTNLFSDLGGVVYSFDSTLDPLKHQSIFNDLLHKNNLDKAPLKTILEFEWNSILKGDLKIYPIKSGIDNLLENQKTSKLIIISTSLVKTSKLILETLNIPTVGVEVFDISDFGSKKDKKAWQQIFMEYTRVDVIVEDDPQNLLVATNAAFDLGFKPVAHLAMPLLTK
jgi:hypothetical protein